MRLAVVDHVGNFGGGSRVVRGLLHGLAGVAPDLEMTYFCNPESLRREAIREELRSLRIEVVELSAPRLGTTGFAAIPGSPMVLGALQERVLEKMDFLPPLISGSVAKELESRLTGFDLAYFPWPYQIDHPRLSCPIVATFHDFNFKYFFGAHTYTPRQVKRLEAQIPVWIEASTPVVSSYFIAAELKKFYPRAGDRTKVIHLASPSMVTAPAANALDGPAVLEELGIRPPYALYPTNTCAHKNIGTLIAAMAILRDRGVRLPLVLSGPGTQSLTGRATASGLQLGGIDPDVIGVGYVSNSQIDALIQCAAVVVSSSLYEAGNGPGLDAWARGVPVAMSDIPAFVEHIGRLGVRASVFDPRDPEDIADKLHEVVQDPQRACADAEASREAMSAHTWRDCAARYLQVFKEASGR